MQIRLNKKLIIGTIIFSTLCIAKVHEYNDINRVKRYLADFKNADNFVDLSSISLQYNIKNFSGSNLQKALKDSDILYVRINDSFISDEKNIQPFKCYDCTNYKLIGYDDNHNPVYEAQKITLNNNGNLIYEIPEGYEIREILVDTSPLGPITYDELTDKEIVVNKEEKAYTLTLQNKNKE